MIGRGVRGVIRYYVSLMTLLSVMALSLSSSPAFAQAAPAYRATVNQSVAKVVKYNATRRGFPANDPRIAATVGAVGAAATTVAVGVGAAVVAGTSIAWGSIIATAVVGTLVSIGIGYGIDWLFGNNGKVKPGEGKPPVLGALVPGAAWYETLYGCSGSSPEAVMQCSAQSSLATYSSYAVKPSIYPLSITANGSGYRGVLQNDGGAKVTNSSSGEAPSSKVINIGPTNYTGPSCDSGMAKGGKCLAYANTRTGGATETQIEDAIKAMSAADQARPVTPSVMAGAINKYWSDASQQPGYSGLPFSPGDPVTEADADAVRQADPASWPSVGDLLQPVAPGATAGQTVPPIKVPDTTQPNAPSIPAGTNPSTQPVQNLGADPGIGSPSAEQEPSISSLFDPFDAMLSGLRGFSGASVPTSGQCPSYTFHFFGKDMQLNGWCPMLEDNRALIGAVMVLAFTIMSLFVLMRA
jgi:hypothetical protein